MIGWDTNINNDSFYILYLRKCSPYERMEILTETVDQFNPDLVFVVGLLDMVNDFTK